MESLRKFLEDESSKNNLPLPQLTKAARSGALAAGVILGAMGGAAPAEAQPATVSAALSEFERTEAPFSNHDIQHLALNLYREAGNQSLMGQLAVAQVTVARALSGKKEFGDSSMEGTIWKKNQFSWTLKHTADEGLPTDAAFKDLVATLDFYLGEKTKQEALAALMKVTDLPADTLYYKRADWNERDLNEKRMSENTKAMFCALSPVGTRGAHTFYADRRVPQKKTATPEEPLQK